MNGTFIFPFSQIYLWFGLGVVVLAVLRWLLKRQEAKREARMERFVEAKLAPRLLGGWSSQFRRPLFWFTLWGVACVGLALAQPHWGKAWREVNRRSHDIVVCLDVSESMLASNPLPNRLERAKQKIAAIVDESYGDRFGLVAFSGGAELMCPLTLDHGYFRNILAAVDTDSIGLEGTDLAASLEVAAATFLELEEAEETDSRAILILSDGEEVTGDALALADKVAETARIFVIGVGDPHGTEVQYVRRLRRAARSTPETHFSALDESRLERIAITGRGGYIRSTADDKDIREIRALIQQLFARDVGGEIQELLVNRYQWPLAVGILCFMAEGAWMVSLPLVSRWRRRSGPADGEIDYA